MEGYWQMELLERYRGEKAFFCHAALFRFKRMPSGLTNAPPTFQPSSDISIANYKWNTYLVYLGDVIVFSQNTGAHIEGSNIILTSL